jgi:hypothetical protein
MKPIIKTLFLVAVLFISYSCDNAKEAVKDATDAVGDMAETKGLSVIDTMKTRAEFNTMRTKWKKEHKLYTDKHVFDYFDVPIDDIRAIANENGATHSRFYFGMGDDSLPHLLLVGMRDTVINFNIIADYTKICPPKCPPPKI